MSIHNDQNELEQHLSAEADQAAAAAQAPETPEEAQAAAASAAEGTKYHPSQVPYLNDAYTFQDRQEELVLMRTLLNMQLRCVNEELAQITHINNTRSFPTIAFQQDK